MNLLSKDVIINKIIPYILEDYKKENDKLKKQNTALKSIMRGGVMHYNAFDDMQCKTCDKHFVVFNGKYERYDKPINILDESTELVFLYCDDCTDYYCMDCVFKTPIETRLTHLYCPVCKHGNDCQAELSKYTY